MEINITREHALKSRIYQLESRAKFLRKAMWLACGVISTMPDRENEHPVDVYAWLVHEALEDERGTV